MKSLIVIDQMGGKLRLQTSKASFLTTATGNRRPISAGRDWPLYGDEYRIMKFGNVPTDGQT
jgi:hypothetical protein